MIRNIIFDLGGVIINLDPSATAKAFIQLGLKEWNSQYSQVQQSGLFDEFDKGKIMEEDFRNALKKYISGNATDEQIDHAWNAMLLDIPKNRMDFLHSIRKQYRIFLLSNTNTIHVKAFSSAMKKEFGFDNFSNIFEKVYYSCDIGMRKPDAEIFEFVLKENSLVAAETLFIDDSKQHVVGALRSGLAGKWLNLKSSEGLLNWWESAERKELFT